MRTIVNYFLTFTLFFLGPIASAQRGSPDWQLAEQELLKHFRALLQFDTSDPPGRELPAAEYIRDVLQSEGFDVEMLAID
ncbi:MAG: peptidase M20, partial [Gammaproteobacteria bacterium]|nr:peptidase M20 [Gammaproteobacteria bacterium]